MLSACCSPCVVRCGGLERNDKPFNRITRIVSHLHGMASVQLCRVISTIHSIFGHAWLPTEPQRHTLSRQATLFCGEVDSRQAGRHSEYANRLNECLHMVEASRPIRGFSTTITGTVQQQEILGGKPCFRKPSAHGHGKHDRCASGHAVRNSLIAVRIVNHVRGRCKCAANDQPCEQRWLRPGLGKPRNAANSAEHSHADGDVRAASGRRWRFRRH